MATRPPIQAVIEQAEFDEKRRHWTLALFDTDGNAITEGIPGPQGPTGATGAQGAAGPDNVLVGKTVDAVAAGDNGRGLIYNHALGEWQPKDVARLDVPQTFSAKPTFKNGLTRIGHGNPLIKATAFPSVMASPPTVTLQTSPTVFNDARTNVLVPATSSVYKYLGALPIAAGAGFPDSDFLKSAPLTSANGSLPWQMVYETDAPWFGLYTKGSGGTFRVYADDVLVSATVTTLPSDGNRKLYLYDFGGAAHRQIRIEAGSNFYFGGIRVGPTYTVWGPSTDFGPRILFLADSVGEGTGANASFTGYTFTLARLLGAQDVCASASGSTGYLNPGSAGRVKLRDRVPTDVIPMAPEVVFVQAGINDSTYPTSGTVDYAALQTEAGALYDAISAPTALPNTRIIVIGPWWPRDDGNTNILQTSAAIKAAADARGLTYIDPYGWITGTGTQATPTATGNSNRYISGAAGDTTHPNQSGHDYFARRLASKVKPTLSFA